MESPVRIFIGAALVANLLLLSSTALANAVPEETTTTKEVKPLPPRYAKVNGTAWLPRGRAKAPDVALNELKPNDKISEEHTEQDSKYKDRGRSRGRVKFNQQRSSTTESPRRKLRPTQTKVKSEVKENVEKKREVVIVTPEPPKKNMTQIIDSMKTFKKTKMPTLASSSTTPVSTKADLTKYDHDDSDYEDDNKNDYNKYKSLEKFHDSNFFSIPSYNDDYPRDEDSYKDGSEKDFSVKPLDKYSSFFPSSFSDKPKSYYYDFDSELTTPKNDFFDKKFHEISSSIMKNLATSKFTAPTANKTKGEKVIKENVNLSNVNNGTPTNKSSVYFKNTKEIRVLDNDGAGSSKQELSDVHGTSIYYEMSVLSTETYAIDNSNDYDCDNDTTPYDVTTVSPTESSSVKVTPPTLISSSKKPKVNIETTTPTPTTTVTAEKPTAANSILSTQKTVKTYRIRNTHSKRLNATSSKNQNSVDVKDQVGSNQFLRPTRKFLSTTPKNKPQWMNPRRNITRTYRPSTPTTIYEEHFDINDRYTTPRTRLPIRTTENTSESDIDPVQQSEISGPKKTVQSLSENNIQGLWKRGSTRFSSTSAPVSESSGISGMEIPPTLTAWALASLKSPPSMASPVANSSTNIQKNLDENELQKVEGNDKKEATTTPVPITTPTISDYSPKIVEINQNRLHWRPIISIDSKNEQAEAKLERLPAESNISEQSSSQPDEITTVKEQNEIDSTTKPSWVRVKNVEIVNTTKEDIKESNDTFPPVGSTITFGFESITKLPTGLTTPQGEEMYSSKIDSDKIDIITQTATEEPSTKNYDITTIKFTYIPTILSSSEPTTETGEENVTDAWYPIIPTRTRITTVDDTPITTYRPLYKTTTEITDESTTNEVEITTQPPTTTMSETTTEEVKTTETAETTVELETVSSSSQGTTEPPTSTETETMTTVVEVVTNINIKKETTSEDITTTLEETTETTTENAPVRVSLNDSMSVSEENSGSNEVITMETIKTTKPTTETEFETTTTPSETEKTTEQEPEEKTTLETTEILREAPTSTDKTDNEEMTESTTDSFTTKAINELEDLTNYVEDVTTEASTRLLANEPVPGVAIAVTVSIIGVLALILLIILLVVVRRRGRRGVYAQRCTPVSLDAYSLDSVSVGPRKGNQRLRASKRSYGNPAFEDEVISHPMNYAALANFAMDIESITAEFAEIPSVTVRPDEVPPGCEDKNRYSNVLPLPETRVPLMRIGSDPTTEYINANYISGPGNIKNYYIACQAPMHNTVVDFWRMIWEQNSRLIVMLTEYMENGVEKCYEYLPPSEVSDNKRIFGDFQIVLKKREQRDKYAISNVQLINLRTRTWREVIHLWYFWPAKGVPDDYDSIIDFLAEMRGFMKSGQNAKEYDEDGIEVIYGDTNRSSYNNLTKLREDNANGTSGTTYSPQREEMLRQGSNGTLARMKAASENEGVRVRPCVVVCASGAGRAAALVALDAGARALAAGRVDVPRTVRALRTQRPHALSNRHHYILLYKVLSEYGNKLMGGGVDTI